MAKLIFKILFVAVLFGLTAVAEHSIMPTAENQVALEQLSSTEASAAMRSYGTFRNYSFVLYAIPFGIGYLMLKKEIKGAFK